MVLDLRNITNLPQMHDCQITKIVVEDEKTVMYIDNSGCISRAEMESDNTIATFKGIPETGYSISFLVYKYTKNLSVKGKEYDGADFITYFEGKKIEIIDILYTYCKVLIKGVIIHNGIYKEDILIDIDADYMHYEYV